MHDEKAGVTEPGALFASKPASSSIFPISAVWLWITVRARRGSAVTAGAVFFAPDSTRADDLSTRFDSVVVIADWHSDVLNWWQDGAANLSSLLGESYGNAPALLLGLGVVFILPLFVIAGFVLRRSQPLMEPGRTMKYPAAHKAPAAGPPAQTLKLPVLGDPALSIQQGDSTEPELHRFNSALMVRIGREDDNDVRLSDPTVHRYHAVISRSAEAGFVISDLSSAEGNGVIVNGKRVRRQRLCDGDIITLGAVKLTFRLH